MIFPSKSRMPKARKFEYVPRYYDAEKEEREERRKKHSTSQEATLEGTKLRISQNLRDSRKARLSASSRAARRYNMLLLGIMAILGVMTFLFIQYYLPYLVKSWF